MSAAIITGQVLGTLGGDLTAQLGFQFAPPQDIILTALGRWVVAGNAGVATLRVYDDQSQVIGTVTIDLGAAAPGAYAYASLPAPLTIAAGATCTILSAETDGGNEWYAGNTPVTCPAAVTPFGSAKDSGSGIHLDNDGAFAYGPVNALYQTPFRAGTLTGGYPPGQALRGGQPGAVLTGGGPGGTLTGG